MTTPTRRPQFQLGTKIILNVKHQTNVTLERKIMPAKNNKPNSSIRVGTVEIAKIWKSPKKMEPRFSQLDVEEHNHAVYIDRRLQLVLSFLTKNGADEEMIDTMAYCINGNRSRINTKLLLN